MTPRSELIGLSVELDHKKKLIAKALEAADALEWLDKYGSQLPHLVGTDDFAVRFHMNFGSACVGVKEAIEHLNAAAETMIEDILARAILDAERAIKRAIDPVVQEKSE